MKRSRFLGLFIDEALQHLEQAQRQLGQFETHPQRPDTLRALMRHCHSLKGMAATMGFEPFVDLSHRMEGLLRELERRPRAWSGELTPLFAEGLDRLAAWAEQISAGGMPRHDATSTTLISRLDSLLGEASTRPHRAAESTASNRPALWAVRLALQVSSASPTHRIVSTLKRVSTLGRVLRVRPPLLPLDDTPAAMELELELASARSPELLRRRIERFAWVSRAELSPLSSVDVGVEKPELPTVWTRVPADSLDWIADTLRELAMERSAVSTQETAAQRSGGERGEFLVRRLFDRVEELRLVPFVSVSHRLEPALRDAARRDGKRARLVVEGGDLGLDRGLLDRLVDPLRHLVRNAVAHGIETAAERRARGKPEEGSVTIAVARPSDRLRVAVRDDGRGMDGAALRTAAVDRGELDPDAAETLDEQDLFRLAFRSGISTRASADRVAGRGAGLDAAARDLAELGATLEVRSAPQRGTEFFFELPVEQALVQSLVFIREGQLFGLPLQALRQATAYGAAPDGVEVVDLGTGKPPEQETGYLLLLDEPDRDVALVADDVIGRRELWLQPVAPAFAATTYVNGAAMIENGALAVVIDPKRLLARSW